MPPQNRTGLRTWIEIDKSAISHNYSELRKILPKNVKYLSVVKSNAYGHSIVDFSLEVEKVGVDYFGVDSLVEAVSLRNSGIKKPILVLGYTLPELLSKAVDFDIEIAVSTFELLEEINKQLFTKKIKIHVKADTGMHRQGFGENEIDKVISVLKKMESKIEVVGLFTHFAAVKNPAFLDYTYKQLESFKIWISDFKKNNFSPIVHAGASGGALVFPEADFDMIRVGIAQYGIWPAKEVKEASRKEIDLKPILQWRTLMSEIKNLPSGSMIGYDLTHELERDSKIAVCPVGYWHGYPRSLSDCGQVLVGGKKVRVLGRVSMDMIVIDVSDVTDPKVGDIVTLIGIEGGEAVLADEVAEVVKCSTYELITRINPLIKKLYL